MTNKKESNVLFNPCVIGSFREPLESLTKDFGARSFFDEEHSIFAKAKVVSEKYHKAVELIKKARLSRALSRMTYCLVPIYDEANSLTALADQKIGGVPDLRSFLYVKCDKEPGFDIVNKLWPRCGCCHHPMKFVGQFDLMPWLLPIHAAFSWQVDSWGRMDEYSYVSGVGGIRLVQHCTQYDQKLFHVFLCANTSHWEDQNCDSMTFISDRRFHLFSWDKKAGKRDPLEIMAETEQLYLNTIRVPQFTDEHAWFLEDKKIVGWDLKFEFDEPKWVQQYDYKSEKRLEKVMEENPDVFNTRSGMKFFGSPRSQQEPKRYWAPMSWQTPARMSPLLSFNDDEADMTYQIYADMRRAEHRLQGKLDSSCT